MIRNRISYWSCSKFADCLRGSKKPHALTLKEWDSWKKEQQAKNAFRFWLAERFLNKLQNFIFFPFDLWFSFKCYFVNRFVSKTHFLKTGLKPGLYHELGDRIINGLFNELKDFVEIKLAHRHNSKKFRCVSSGMAYLKWASELKNDFLDKDHPDHAEPSDQAKAAIEIKKLYEWWENRKTRPDPHDLSGWTEAYKKGLEEERLECYNKSCEIENQYKNEDTEMIIRLIKIRDQLWT